MNKTLMLVICDFLLLSMLALARFDPPEDKKEPGLDATAASASAEAELIELLEESLQAEQGSRENLSSDLQETRETLQEKARALEEREAALAETLANLERTSAEAEALAKAKAEAEETKAELAAEREKLAQRFEATREELQKASEERVELASTLGTVKEARSVSEERLKQTEKELRDREAQLARREAELKAAQKERERMAAEQAELNKALEVAQTERRLLSENLTKEQMEKAQAFARAERLGENVAVLGEGVNQLGQGVNQLGQGVDQIGQNVSKVAQSSEEIQKEMEAARPRTMSEIFTRFQENRATIRFTSQEQGLFGGTVERSYDSRSILVKGPDGNYYLVTHSNNSPFDPSKASRVESAALEVSIGSENLQLNQIGFLAADPRLIFIPLPKIVAENSGLESFPLALQPERWEEAVLVKNDEINFGRTEFRRLTSSARFLKMERPALGELFADFAASRGDLAFTKNSQFIGILTDTRHAVVIDDFVASAVLDLGNRFDPVAARDTIDKLQDRVRQLPSEVR
ncbi:MAG TPA: hypothetical protein VJ952_11300 [Opitutales bacterium]|nr:hypothetical protein [Opitutales bacterium]